MARLFGGSSSSSKSSGSKGAPVWSPLTPAPPLPPTQPPAGGPCWLRRLARIAASPLAQRPAESSPCSRHMREASAVSVSLATASTCGQEAGANSSNATTPPASVAVDAAAVALVSAAVDGDGCGLATAVTAATLAGLPQSALVNVYTAAITKALRDERHVELANAFSSAYVGINEAVARRRGPDGARLEEEEEEDDDALPLPPALQPRSPPTSTSTAAPEFLEALLEAAGRTARAAGCRASEPFLRELWRRMRSALPRVPRRDLRRWFEQQQEVGACGFFDKAAAGEYR